MTAVATTVLLMASLALLPRPARADEAAPVDGWTIDSVLCTPDAAARAADDAACAALGGTWRARTRACECSASGLGTVAPTDRSTYQATSSDVALAFLDAAARRARIPTLYAVTVDLRDKVLARYRLATGKPLPKPGKGAVTAVVIVDAKTWAKTRVGAASIALRALPRFVPTRAQDQPQPADELVGATRKAIIAITGAAEPAIMMVNGRVRFGPPGK